MGNNNLISKLEKILDKSLNNSANTNGDTFKKIIEKEKKSFTSLNSEDKCASIDNEAKTKRYFVSYYYNNKKGLGFGNIIQEGNSLDVREVEKHIRTECNFSSVVVLNYKEMKEDENNI